MDIRKIVLLTVLFFVIKPLSAQEGITARQFFTYEKFLASDQLEGRFPGTDGNNKAAAYIKKQFKKSNLKPLNGSYFQQFKLSIKPNVNSIQSDTVETNNVIGYLEGSDPILKSEFIVIGAHYDHLGWGGKGTGSKKKDTFAIHNGADDNASGFSALLTIAKEMGKRKSTFKRSIVFVSFSGEEEGLEGSKYITEHFPVADSSVKLMINMDMVGRLNAEKQIYMGGAGTFPGGEVLMKKLGVGSGLSPVVNAGSIGGSDHVSFYKKNISVIGLHTGGNPQYHTPEDDIELINKEGAALVCKYIYNTLLQIANYEQPLYFIKQD